MSEESAWIEHRDWQCDQCHLPLEVRQINVEYLGSAFPVNLLACPQCGLVLIPEDLAMGKMAKVEQELEDK